MASSSTRFDFSRARILLVDDNQQSLALMMQVLSGFRVKEIRTCSSAAEAKSTLGIWSFDLLMIDAEMPEEDGLSLIRYLRNRFDQPNFTTPVILVSSRPSVDKIRLARDTGANMVVKKPISPSVLLGRIAWLAGGSRPFVTTDTYSGPDRRFKAGPMPENQVERRAGAIALTADPTRALSQDDIDSLFG